MVVVVDVPRSCAATCTAPIRCSTPGDAGAAPSVRGAPAGWSRGRLGQGEYRLRDGRRDAAVEPVAERDRDAAAGAGVDRGAAFSPRECAGDRAWVDCRPA